MLRTLGVNRPHRSLARIASFAIVGLIGLAVAGLRGPGVTEIVAQAEEPAVPANTASQYDFSYVPENFFGLIAIRPAEIAADPRLEPLAKLLEQALPPGMPSELVEQATLVEVAPKFDDQGRIEDGSGGEQFVIHTKESVDFENHLKKANSALKSEEHEGHELLISSPSPHSTSYFRPDETTLIGRGRIGLLKLLGEDDPSKEPADAELWQSEVKGPLLIVYRNDAMGMRLRESLQSSVTPEGLWQVGRSLAPLVRDVETTVCSIDTRKELQIHVLMKCNSAEDVSKVIDTINAVAVIAQNSLETLQVEQEVKDSSPPGYGELLNMALTAIREKLINTEGNDVRLVITLGETEAVVKLIADTLAPAIESARAAAQVVQSINDLRRLALAMHNYRDVHKSFPPAVGFTYREGDVERRSAHLHSWRVAILPYIEHIEGKELYEKYQFDEPWDSEANTKVLDQMPEVFRSPHDDPSSTNTSYFVFTGPETLFVGAEGTRLRNITDGTSQTLLMVEAKRPVPWTKPEDIPYAVDQPVQLLGGWIDGEFVVAHADGSVRRVSTNVEEATLRGWITKAGRETVPDLPQPNNRAGREPLLLLPKTDDIAR